jgi:poly(A) polymerase
VRTTLSGIGWFEAGAVRDLLVALNGQGSEARVVGGAVRNALIGLAPGDIDLATTALPDDTMRRVTAAGFHAVPTGFEHGTITAVRDGVGHEVTTLREDVETFGRHATVRFGHDWARDAERRDFTMNALSATPDGAVHDYVGGLADLAARRVRFIGDPAQRIAEDYLRILRFFRFHATYGHGAHDADGLHAVIMQREGLAGLSRERVRQELVKILTAPGALAAIIVMADSGLLGLVLAGVGNAGALRALSEREAQAGIAPAAMRRLAALGVLVAEDAQRLSERLRLTNAESSRLAVLAESWREAPGWTCRAIKARLLHGDRAEIIDALLVGAALTGTPVAPDVLATARDWPVPEPPFRGSDVLAAGISPGPVVGHILTEAEALWVAADFPEDPDHCRALLATAVARHRL